MICFYGNALSSLLPVLFGCIFCFYDEEVQELLTYSRLKFLVRYLLRVLSFSLHLRPQEPVKVQEKDGEVSRRLYLKRQNAPL